MENGSLDWAVVLHGSTREAKKKLSPPKLLDKAQIAFVVQSIRSEGQQQTQSSPILMLKIGDTNYTSTWPKSTQNAKRITSVKGKNGVARNRFSFGEHSSAVGGQNSSCAIFS